MVHSSCLPTSQQFRKRAHLSASAAAERLPPPARGGAPRLLELSDGAPLALALHHHLLVLDALVALAAVEPRALHRVRRVRHEEPCSFE